jgi:hypothetical protein
MNAANKYEKLALHCVNLAEQRASRLPRIVCSGSATFVRVRQTMGGAGLARVSGRSASGILPAIQPPICDDREDPGRPPSRAPTCEPEKPE